MRQRFDRQPSSVVTVFAVALAAFVAIVLISEIGGSDDALTLADTTEISTRQTPVSQVPLDALETDMGVYRVVNARLGIDRSRDSGATCERISRTRFACSVLRGEEDIATGWWIRCPPPRSLDDWAAWCSVSQRMTPQERCQFGVRSGIPFTGGIWAEEAVICRKLGVPIE